MPEGLKHLLRPELSELRAYVPAHPEGIRVRLDANEAPPLRSPAVHEAVRAALAAVPLERYPDARALELKEAIGKVTGARPEELLVGSGSDEVIALVLTAMARPRPRAPQATMLTATPTFVMYRVSARAHGIKPVEVPLDAAWDLDVGGMKRAVELLAPNVVFIASPNNPTGNRMTLARVEAVLEAAADALVIVDEAYIDYAGESLRGLRARHPNLGILRTVSKLGLAALRVGWLEADAALVAELDKVRQPFNLSATSQAAAAAVLRVAWGAVREHVGAVCAERERLVAELGRLEGVTPSPTSANFVWVETAREAAQVHAQLQERGVLVRSFHAVGGRLKHRLRVTVGTPEQDDIMLAALAEAAR